MNTYQSHHIHDICEIIIFDKYITKVTLYTIHYYRQYTLFGFSATPMRMSPEYDMLAIVVNNSRAVNKGGSRHRETLSA